MTKKILLEFSEKEKALESKDQRKQTLEDWISHDLGLRRYQLQIITPDASFRRYFRVFDQEQNHTYIAMDANPEQEDCQAFIAIAQHLRTLGLQTPEIISSNLKLGFLLITDFGDATYLKILNDQNADVLYTRALESLTILQSCKEVPGKTIPKFNETWLWQEWVWYQKWFLNHFLSLPTDNIALDANYAVLVESASAQPQVFMHRDYHSANLMLLKNDNVGILDFQDAFIGPITYDLASLLRDCYIDWPNEKVSLWAGRYCMMLRDHMQIDEGTFLRWFDLMGIQRHLKALITFSRKYIRDQDPRYLKYIPRTLNYLETITQRYRFELKALHAHLSEVVIPAYNRVSTICEE